MASRDTDAHEGERHAERVAVDEQTRLRPNHWSSIEIRIIDLSCAGFKAQCDARLAIGSCVTLDVKGVGEVEAQVEWQRAGLFGARFLSEIDLGRCAWAPRERSNVLARLLVERATARKVGRDRAEAHLRRRILESLPVRRGGASA